MTEQHSDTLVERLGSFDAAERRDALERLGEAFPGGPTKPEVNLHCHTFFSYNASGYSPSRFAWEARRYGLAVAGIVDFDVLDGVEEFLEAGRLLALKTVAGFETRVFVPEYADKVLNSPNEPGVFYLVGSGFTHRPEPGTTAAATLAKMAGCARDRNMHMAELINEYLAPVTVDYERDVVSLTPAGNATERHMLTAYDRRARELFSDDERLAAFWSEKLGEPVERVRALLDDVVSLKNLIRSRLMKYGGVGYAAPEQGSFPTLDDVVRMTLDCGAVPSGCWLDGTSDGEEDTEGLFRFLRSKGVPTVTIIPDRNWNIKDPDERATKIRNFQDSLAAAERLAMPVFVGTEMNKAGAKFVDTFDAPEMSPHRDAFLDGAHFAWGHTLLKMTAGMGCTGAWADEQFGDDLARRNAFFRRLGEMAYPGTRVLDSLAGLGPDAVPGDVLRAAEG